MNLGNLGHIDCQKNNGIAFHKPISLLPDHSHYAVLLPAVPGLNKAHVKVSIPLARLLEHFLQHCLFDFF